MALIASALHDLSPDNPTRAAARTLVAGAALVLAGPVATLAVRRRAATPGEIGLAALIGASIVLGGLYLFWASPAILLKADALIWSEGLFVGDILKVRVGYPLFTAPANLESTFYPPGASMLTYALAALSGHATSIPAYRIIQLCYAAAGAVVGSLAALRLYVMARPERPLAHPVAWGACWGGLLFLCATNALTNPFAHLLHNDALGVLVSCVAFALLAEYAAGRSVRMLALLAFLPAAGFYVKQSLVIWAALVTGYLLVFDRPRSLARTAAYAVAAFGIAGLAYGAGRLAWGQNFYYWTIQDLQNHPFSVLRSVQHGLEAWAWFGAGIAGAIILFGRHWRELLGVWVVWLLLLLQEAYTSGIAWMVNHLGPGSMIAGIWLAAALASAWPRGVPRPARAMVTWMRAGFATALVLLVFAGLGFVREPVTVYPEDDLRRYIGAIEREFTGQDAKQVLLDHGTWVYLPQGVVPKDRSALVGDLGYSAQGDFSGLLERIRTKAYQRILMHDLHTRNFGYDHWLWRTSSGIREALLANYREVRTIPAVRGQENGTPYLREISVLEPIQ